TIPLRRNSSGARAPCARLSAGGGGRVLLAEFVDAAGGVDDLLLARVERVAGRAHFDLKGVAERRARLERVPAGAGHADFRVVRVRVGLHDAARLGGKAGPKGRAV